MVCGRINATGKEALLLTNELIHLFLHSIASASLIVAGLIVWNNPNTNIRFFRLFVFCGLVNLAHGVFSYLNPANLELFAPATWTIAQMVLLVFSLVIFLKKEPLQLATIPCTLLGGIAFIALFDLDSNMHRVDSILGRPSDAILALGFAALACAVYFKLQTKLSQTFTIFLTIISLSHFILAFSHAVFDNVFFAAHVVATVATVYFVLDLVRLRIKGF